MKTTIAALVFACGALFSSVSFAGSGEKAVIADCRDGGCRCSLSEVTLEEAAIVLNVPYMEGAKTLITYGKNQAMWSPLSHEEVDAKFGGDGRCDLEVFGSILPKDGVWTGTVRTKSFKGCPDAAQQIVSGSVAAMVFTRDIRWNGTFDPSLLSAEGTQQPVAWVEASPTVFHGSLILPPNAKALGMSGRLLASLLDESAAVANMDLVVMGCAVDVTYDFKRTAG